MNKHHPGYNSLRARLALVAAHVNAEYMRGADGLLHRRRIPLDVTETPSRNETGLLELTPTGKADARWRLRQYGLEDWE